MDAYLVGSDTGEIHRYITITNPYQLSAFSFSSSKDISATDTTPLDIYLGYCNDFNSFNEVYLHNIFILGGQNNTIYRFQSSDNFTFTFSLLQSFSVASQTTSPKSFIFSSGGKKLYVLASNGTIYQYSNNIAFTFNSTTFDSVTYSVTQDNDCVAIRFDRSGYNLFIAGNQNKKIYHFTLNTRWDISTASFNTEYYVGSQVNQLVGLTISPLGDNFQVVSSGVGADIYQYDIA